MKKLKLLLTIIVLSTIIVSCTQSALIPENERAVKTTVEAQQQIQADTNLFKVTFINDNTTIAVFDKDTNVMIAKAKNIDDGSSGLLVICLMVGMFLIGLIVGIENTD